MLMIQSPLQIIKFKPCLPKGLKKVGIMSILLANKVSNIKVIFQPIINNYNQHNYPKVSNLNNNTYKKIPVSG